MPKISGKDIISEATEKTVRRAIFIGSIGILTKIYDVPLGDLKVLGMDLPPALFDVALVILVIYAMYSLFMNWLFDVAAFRLWYRESSIWSSIGTDMKLDKDFIQGGLPLLEKLHELENGKVWPADYSKLDEKLRQEYEDFKMNVRMYCERLEYAGTRFRLISTFGLFYVWVCSFLIPMMLCACAIYLLFTYGTFTPPARL